MALAIFLDAHSVAGDPSLLEGVRSEVDRQVERDDAVLGHFAAAIDSFPDVLGGWWNHLPLIGDADKAVDLKKAGIFPIVHGVRSLALREHIGATSTSDRVEALVSKGRLASELARDLLDSLHFLMTLKLKAGLDELDSGRSISGTVRTDRMTTLERDLFKDALGVVKRFKTLVRHQMHLEMA